MISSKIVLTSTIISVLFLTPANAGSYVTLDAPDQKQSIQTLGTAPVKKKIVLDLGALRSGEAELPGGLLTIADRMKLRVKQALDRHKAVARAKRKKKSSEASFVETMPEQPNSDYSDGEDPIIE